MKTNPEYYKWGVFYFNREDSRVFVPKMVSRTGWTLNFARPETYLIIAGIVLLAIISSKI